MTLSDGTKLADNAVDLSYSNGSIDRVHLKQIIDSSKLAATQLILNTM